MNLGNISLGALSKSALNDSAAKDNLRIQVNEVEFCKLEVHYVAEPPKVAAKRKEAIAQLRKANIPGFRPGKAPDHAIEIKMKKQIEEWMKRELLAEAYDDILFETKVKPIGYPQVKRVELHDSEFWCDLIMLKKPEFELKQYKDFEIPKPHLPMTAAESVEKLLQELRVQHGSMAPYGENDFVQEGDKVTLDFKCVVDEQVFDGATREGILYKVGDKLFPEFDDNILGMMAGEERTFDVVFNTGVQEELKDKKATFTVKVHMGMRTTPAPLDDDLAKKSGFEDLAKLREAAEGISASRIQSAEAQQIAQQVIKKIIAEHDFTCPVWLVSMEAQQLSAQMGHDWKVLNPEQRDIFMSQATNNVKLAFIMDEIRELEPETVFSDMELVNVIKQRVSAQGQDPEKFLVETQKDGRLLGILASLRNEAMIQWLVAQSKIVE
ncbi:MAG TPA: trigger factor [Anaerovoracaceae bacterium]|nr:trigger factor [Anaerovoracaceae bacterium]